jgi:SAM-dependent methyltransferase
MTMEQPASQRDGGMPTEITACPYCGSSNLAVTHRNLRHKVDTSFGPFDIMRCADCGSAATRNPPAPSRLAEFYTHYHLHRPDWYNRAAASTALVAQYRFYANFLARQMQGAGSPRWIDIGAGHGEVANLLAAQLPSASGLAVDITGRPSQLAPDIEYRSLDMNAPEWLGALGSTFDFVYSVAVWEHVLDPQAFATQALSLVAPGGTLVLICPDYGSAARRVLGQRWPYFEPGEHLSMPSRAGARACLIRAAR